MTVEQQTLAPHPAGEAGFVARLAMALTAWTERWLPDAFIFALVFTAVVVIAAVAATPSTLVQAVDAWGRGFWDLIPFTLQMALVVITGHVLASSQPMARLIRAMATWPSSPRAAVAFVALVAMGSSWLHWGFSLMFSALLAREVARRVDGVDYRALAAASYMGMGGQGRRDNYQHPISGGDIGEFMAMSTSGEILWEHRQRAAFNTAALTTAGGLVFIGDWNRYINAYDVKTGDLLWQTRAATSAQGFPMSYAVRGRQYIAMPVGVGAASWGTDIPLKLTPELKRPNSGNAIMVFALPQAPAATLRR